MRNHNQLRDLREECSKVMCFSLSCAATMAKPRPTSGVVIYNQPGQKSGKIASWDQTYKNQIKITGKRIKNYMLPLSLGTVEINLNFWIYQ